MSDWGVRPAHTARPGSYAFVCTIHVGMSGTLTVE